MSMHAWGKTILVSWILATGLVSSVACDGNNSDASQLVEALQGRQFYAHRVTENGQEKSVVPDTHLLISFHEDQKLSASAWCNGYSTAFKIEDEKIVLGQGVVTSKGCEKPIMDQEDWYFDFLGSSPTIEFERDQLTLRSGVTIIEYLDKEIVTPDLALVGHRWVVIEVIEGQLAMGAVWNPPAWFQFMENNRFLLSTGCNEGEGQYTVEGDELRFTMVAQTEKACTDMTAAKLEEVVQKILFHSGPIKFEIDASQLRLFIEDYGLYLYAD